MVGLDPLPCRFFEANFSDTYSSIKALTPLHTKLNPESGTAVIEKFRDSNMSILLTKSAEAETFVFDLL